MRFLFLVAAVLFVSPAFAADEPETVFAQYHRAALKADIATVLRLSTEAQRARMKIDIDWEERAKAMPHVMPSAYTVTGRAAGATRVILNIDATGGAFFSTAPDKPGKSKGKVSLLQEGGEWRVDRLEFQPVSEARPYDPRPITQGGDAPTLVNPTLPKPVLAPGGRGAAQSATPR
jgi:hypothetical protein